MRHGGRMAGRFYDVFDAGETSPSPSPPLASEVSAKDSSEYWSPSAGSATWPWSWSAYGCFHCSLTSQSRRSAALAAAAANGSCRAGMSSPLARRATGWSSSACCSCRRSSSRRRPSLAARGTR